MNIIRALFGGSTAAQEASRSAEHAYLNDLIHRASHACSMEELLDYARHPSGYVRQAAIERCVALGRTDLLLPIAERLNDWVPQVRTLARAGILTVLPFIHAAELLAITPTVVALVRRGRDHYVEWLEQYETALVDHVGAEHLIQAARDKQVKVARIAVRLLLAHRLVEVQLVVDILLERRDDIVLADQIIALIAQLPAAERHARYCAAATSQFGAVRAGAMKMLLNGSNGAETDVAMAKAALSDPHSSVRFIATQFLQQRDYDVRQHYRSMLSDPQSTARQMRICLTALAGFRQQDDLACIQPFTRHALVLLRTAAFAAWFKLVESDKDAIALTALNDGAPRVIKLALALVRKRGAYIPLTAIQARLLEKTHVALLLEFSTYSKWNHLESIARLSLACDLSEAMALGLDAQLHQWCRKCKYGWMERPAPEQMRFLFSHAVVRALQRLLPAEKNLDPYLRQELIR